MFSNFVLMVITPMLMVVVFQREKQAQLLLIMGLVALLTVLFHLLAIFVTRFVYPPGGDDRSVIERLLAICSNCGYIGIPLLTAVMGPDGAVYATVYIGVFNFYIWTHGVMTVRKSRSISLREALTSPGIVGVALGVALFLLQLRIPSVALEAMEYVSSMNTPLPTIITGVFIADISLKEALANGGSMSPARCAC
jgi:predicted permease